MTKMLLPSPEPTILIIKFLSANLKTAFKALQKENFKKHLITKKIFLTTRQPKKLRNLLVRAKFETKTITKSLNQQITKSPKLTGLFLFSSCIYYNAGYIIPCSLFSFKLTNGNTIT